MGHIEGISAGVVFGWVCVSWGATSRVDVAINGIAIGSFDATIERSDIVPVPAHQPAKGFAIDLHQYLNTGQLNDIAILEQYNGLPLAGSPLTSEIRLATGVVDAVVGPDISGWVVIGALEPSLANLELWVDGRLNNVFKATQLRTDLRAIGITRTRCGFRCRLPEQFWDGQLHAIQLKVQGTDCVLREGDFNISVTPDANENSNNPTAGESPANPEAKLENSLEGNLALLGAGETRFMLHILHAWGGGTQSHVFDMCARLRSEGVASLLLHPDPSGSLKLTNPGNGETVAFAGPPDPGTLAGHLSNLGVWHIHVHHTIGLPQFVWALPEMLGVAFDVTVHDHYFACPRVNLLHANGTYCGQPLMEECERCVKAAPLQALIRNTFEALGGTVGQWRGHHRACLDKARRVFAPSHDAARRTALNFSRANIQLQPHPEPPMDQPAMASRPAHAALRVALIGHIALNKGHMLLLEVARLALTQQPTLRFISVGDTCDDAAYTDLPNVDILGGYAPTELPGLVRLANCQVALFLSNWPETYSYTLSEAWRAGLFPVVTGLGAQAERVRASGQGIVLSAQPTAQEVVNALQQLHQVGFQAPVIQSPPQHQVQQACLLRDYYQLQRPD